MRAHRIIRNYLRELNKAEVFQKINNIVSGNAHYTDERTTASQRLVCDKKAYVESNKIISRGRKLRPRLNGMKLFTVLSFVLFRCHFY